ncbi:MAG: anti-sigma factor family protein, partial [Gemmatimonadales bacterium]
MMTDPWTHRLSEYLDGDLTAAERAALERHLAACPACSTTLAELTRVVMRARALPAPPPGSD